MSSFRALLMLPIRFAGWLNRVLRVVSWWIKKHPIPTVLVFVITIAPAVTWAVTLLTGPPTSVAAPSVEPDKDQFEQLWLSQLATATGSGTNGDYAAASHSLTQLEDSMTRASFRNGAIEHEVHKLRGALEEGNRQATSHLVDKVEALVAGATHAAPAGVLSTCSALRMTAVGLLDTPRRSMALQRLGELELAVQTRQIDFDSVVECATLLRSDLDHAKQSAPTLEMHRSIGGLTQRGSDLVRRSAMLTPFDLSGVAESNEKLVQDIESFRASIAATVFAAATDSLHRCSTDIKAAAQERSFDKVSTAVGSANVHAAAAREVASTDAKLSKELANVSRDEAACRQAEMAAYRALLAGSRWTGTMKQKGGNVSTFALNVSIQSIDEDGTVRAEWVSRGTGSGKAGKFGATAQSSGRLFGNRVALRLTSIVPHNTVSLPQLGVYEVVLGNTLSGTWNGDDGRHSGTFELHRE